MVFKLRLKNTSFSGQSLIEVVVSIGVAVILAISLITTSLITQKSARSARNNTQATKLVQQTLEQLRVLRDRKGFATFPSALTSACFTFNSTDSDPINWTLIQAPSCPSLLPISLDVTTFNRNIEMINHNADANKRLITVTVSWDESGQTKMVKSQTVLGLWQGFP